MKYDYCDPTGNITVLVRDEVPAEKQPEVSSFLCRLEPGCEQVGFVSSGDAECDIGFRMAGGEFCGNATMSAAALFLRENGVQPGQKRTVTVRASGVKKPIRVEAERLTEKDYRGRVEMPAPLGMVQKDLAFEGQTYRFDIVLFEGMQHIVTETAMDRAFAERALKQWCREAEAPAMGVMLIGPGDSLTPLVYVRGVDTLYWEHSCGSGTAAAGYRYFKKTGMPVKKTFAEPGGTVSIEADAHGRLFLTGRVTLVRESFTDKFGSF